MRDGGLGVRDLQAVNEGLLTCTAWRIAADETTFVSKILKENLKNLTTAAWKSKLLPPRIQTFAWRLSRKALATGERGSTLSRHIEKFCKRCGQVENELHLFFTCEYA